jgi:hypothetical protein
MARVRMRRRLSQTLKGKADDYSDQAQDIAAQEPSLFECASHFNSDGDNLQEDCAMRREAGTWAGMVTLGAETVTLGAEFDFAFEIFFPYVAQEEDTNV